MEFSDKHDPLKRDKEEKEVKKNTEQEAREEDNTSVESGSSNGTGESDNETSDKELYSAEKVNEETEKVAGDETQPASGNLDATQDEDAAPVPQNESSPNESDGDSQLSAKQEKISKEESSTEDAKAMEKSTDELAEPAAEEEEVEKEVEEKSADQKNEDKEKSDVEAADTVKEDGEEDKEDDGEDDEENSADQKKQAEEERVNYELLSKADLVKLLEEKLNNTPFAELRSSIDTLHEVYLKKHEQEIEEKKAKFLEEGGLEQDFKPADDPVDQQLNELINKYKGLKADFNKKLEEEKEVNLATKQEILEEFRILMEGQETFDNTFRKFKQLQTRWFEVGIVPKQNVKDLWNSYNYFVDKFNDYVKINRELRDMDLKKNLELKEKLCEKAEALSADPNVSAAFKKLQKLHSQWREIGQVPREDKDAIWERFKAATSVINKAHQEFQVNLKDSLVDNLHKKEKLCEKAEAIAAEKLSSHKDWSASTKSLLAIQKEWKTIGYAPKKDNNLIYERFRKACDVFFENKAAFYAATYEQQKENLEQKTEIVVIAERLKDDTDWKGTTDKLIELQKLWKEIGPVPRKESDKLWKRFRSACDYFFNKKSEHFSGSNDSYDENLSAKEAIIKEIKNFKEVVDKNQALKQVESFQNRYNEIGFVPVEAKDRIKDEFKEAINGLIDRLDLDDSEKSIFRFKLRIAGLINYPRAENKLHFEREKLLNKLQQLKNDISVWENNIGFFKETSSAESTLHDFHEKIDDAHKRIEVLEQKVSIINDFEDQL